jgi:predicted RNA-binding Zn-ribbon protein involved in translation (DUF1610 family)
MKQIIIECPDLELFREQRKFLLECEHLAPNEEYEALMSGIIHFLDHVSDAIAEQTGKRDHLLESPEYEYVCPDCGETDYLRVTVVITAEARLLQEPCDDNIQTDVDGGDHEWDDDSRMWCTSCGRDGKAKEFKRK